MPQKPLSTRSLTKRYSEALGPRAARWLLRREPPRPALEGLDLDIEGGEVLGLLGPNGAGKTKTIGLALGLLWPSAGSIEIFGAPPQDPAARARVGYLPETTTFPDKLTGQELVELFGRLRGLTRHEARRGATTMIAKVGMAGKAGQGLHSMSKGMARRIGLAATMVGQPTFLILDEPTSGLDPVGRKELKDLLLQLKSEGTTLLVSSHLLTEIEDVCDRIALLDQGRLVSSGPLDKLLVDSQTHVLVTREADPATLEETRRLLGDTLLSERSERESLEAFFVRQVGAQRSEP